MFADNIFEPNKQPLEISEEQAKAGRIDRFGYDPEDPQSAIEGPMPKPKPLPGSGYEPGLFEGSWEAPLKGVAAGIVRTAGSVTGLIGDTFNAEGFQEFSRDMRMLNRKYLDPDPEEMGEVAQIIFGFSEFASKAAGYALTMGPIAGSVAFGADTGLGEYYKLKDEGVKPVTAAKAGAATAAANTLGVLIPAASGTSRAVSAAYGAGANVALDLGERAAVRAILEADNYQKIANRYETSWGDVALSVGLGAFFGTVAWRSPTQIREEQINRRAKAIAEKVTERLMATNLLTREQAETLALRSARGEAIFLMNANKSDDELLNWAYQDAIEQLQGGDLAQIVGPTGADRLRESGADIAYVEVAEKMEAQGKTPREIRMATGWERGADGKWRYEIDDIKLKDGWFEPVRAALKKVEDEYGRRQDEALKSEENAEEKYFALEDEMRKEKERVVVSRPLSEIVDAPEVFAAYPQLRDFKIEFGPLPDRVGGAFNLETKVLRLPLWTLSDKSSRSTLAHEVQHAIQQIEGFTIGANPASFPTKSLAVWRDLARLRELRNSEAWKAYKKKSDEIWATEDFSKEDLDELDRLKSDPSVAAAMDEIDRLREKWGYDESVMRAVNDEEWNPFSGLDPLGRAINEADPDYRVREYRRVAGEVESRNVQTRLDLTDEERKEKLLRETEDVHRDRQHVNVSSRYSASYDADVVTKAKALVGRVVDRFFNGESTNGHGRDSYEDFMPVTDAAAEEIMSATGLDVRGYVHNIIDSGVGHIHGRHGPGYERNAANVPFLRSDFERLPEVLSAPDSISNGESANSIEFRKSFDDGTFCVVEVVIKPNKRHRGQGKLSLKTAYKKRRKKLSGLNSAMEIAPSAVRPERAEPASSLEPSISDLNRGVKSTLLQQRIGNDVAGAFDAETNTARLTRFADLTTFSHEHSHWYMTKLLRYAGEEGMSAEIVEDAKRLLNALGIKSLEDWNAMSFEEQRAYHERFAAWTEIYLTKGKSPVRGLEGVFERLAQWLLDLYRNKFGKDAEAHVSERYKAEFGDDLPQLSDEVRAVLDRMYGAEAKKASVIPSAAQTVAARIAQAERANTDRTTAPMNEPNSQTAYRASREAQRQARQQINEGGRVDVSAAVDESDVNTRVVDAQTKSFARTAQMGGSNETIVVLQNRDRSTVASQAQMNSIAADPQYGKLSFSRTTDSGAPIVSYGSLPAQEFVGNTDYVTDRGQRVPVTYAVVEADSIMTSNSWDGRPNEAYGTDPEQMQAVAGNGRVAGLQEAYNRGTTDAYVQEMQADTTHGVSPEAIGKLKKPVLVRYVGRENVTTGFVDRSNQSAVLDLSGKERAVKDAGKLTSARMRGYTFDEDGNPTRDTLERFVNDIGEPSSLGALVDDSGLPTDRARDRIRAAVFYAAYRDEDLTALVVDSSDKQGIKRILNAMSAFAPNVIAIREASNGAIDLGPIIVEAVNRIRSGRLIGEGDMFEETNPAVDQVFNILSQNRNSAAAIGRVFNDFMDRIESALGGGTDALFGDAPDLAMAMQYLRAAENAQGERLLELGKEFAPLPNIDVESVRATLAALQEAAPNAEKVAVAMGEKVLEDAGVVTKAEPEVESPSIDPRDPARAGLVFTESADVERLRNLFAEDPEASYVIEGPDGVAREMTAQDILDMERQYAEQGQTDAVGIGKATECILRNGGIKE